MYGDVRKKNLRVFLKWFFYSVLLCICYVLQATPSLFVLADVIKPLLIAALCICVASCEYEFAGAIFGAIGGLMWDVSAGRQVGMFSLLMMVCCFFVGLAVRLYFRNSYFNVMVFSLIFTLTILGFDFLFTYVIFNYSAKSVYFFGVLFPICIYTAAVSPIFLLICKKISKRFSIE